MKLISALLFVLTTTSAQAAVTPSEVAAYRALIAQDLRLAATGYRLVSANAAHCSRKERNPGWVIHDVAQYPGREIAVQAFGFATPIQIAALVKGGPADLAEIKAGDGFLGLDKVLLDWTSLPVGKTGYERMHSFKKLLDEKWRDKPSMSLQLSRDGRTVAVTLAPPLVCRSDFQIDTDDGLDAGADGEIVRITYGMMRYANDDAELAAIVAHELSHNILRHREKLNIQGVDRGLGRFLGKSRKAILATEIEADQLSVWLMANAGFEPKAALRFWERYGRQYGQGIFSEGTHMRWKSRVKLMQTQIDLMAQTELQAGSLRPPLLSGG